MYDYGGHPDYFDLSATSGTLSFVKQHFLTEVLTDKRQYQISKTDISAFTCLGSIQ